MKTPPGSSAVAETRRGAIEYLLEGSSGPVVLGLHGSPGSCFQAAAFLDRLGLSGDNCRRLCCSRPGYGRTPLASGRSVGEQSELFAALLDHLGFDEPAIVFGFSGGGISALDFAVRQPERAAKLLLLSPVTGPTAMFDGTFLRRLGSRIVFSAPFMKSAGILLECFPGLAVDGLFHYLSTLHGPAAAAERKRIKADPEDREFLLNALRRTAAGHWRCGIWNDDRNVLAADRAAWSKLRQPVLLLHGDCDADVSIEQSEQLCELLPETTELVRIPGGSHFLTLRPRLDDLRRRTAAFCGLVG